MIIYIVIQKLITYFIQYLEVLQLLMNLFQLCFRFLEVFF